MSNFLRKYSTEVEFNADSSITCSATVVSYVEDAKSIEYAPEYVNGASIKAKSIKLSSSSPIKIEGCQPSNVLCALDDGSYVMTLSGETQGTPIGVCVIPTSHNVYGDGTCAVMSLRSMSVSNPSGGDARTGTSLSDSGSIATTYCYWGGYGVDISGCTELLNYDVVPNCGTASSQSESISGTSSYAYLPMDRYSGNTKCLSDTTRGYNSSSNTAIPSPYKTDGSRNPMYYQTSSPSSSANALSDFSGFGNTKIITDLATYQSDWKTAESITNGYSSGQYPAACCCWRYTANGKTDEGMWYLPACGEIGYMIADYSKHQAVLGALSVGVQLGSN